MSACPPQIFCRYASPDGRFAGCFPELSGSVRALRRNASTVSEPLAPFAGAAAFLIARSRSFTWPRASVKEPIENQANRHL
jgi:hypothetical protein